MAYTLFIDGDKKQVNGSAITASSTKIVGGTAFGLGTSVPSGSVMTAQIQLGDRTEVYGSQVIQSKDVFGAFQSAPVALTSVADNGSGKCRFTLASHGLTVDTVISVTGSTGGAVNGVQKITAVPTANTFDTDLDYAAAATAGNYATVAGRFASMTVGQYLMLGYSSSVANGQATRVGYGADYGIRRSIHKVEHVYTRRVATAIRAGYWDFYSGTWSTEPTNADDVATIGTDHAATPTDAIPGELVYRHTGMPDGTYGVVQDDYKARTD